MHEVCDHTQASSPGQWWTLSPLNYRSRWVLGSREFPQKYALLPLRCLAWHPWTHQEGSGSELDAPAGRKTIEGVSKDQKKKGLFCNAYVQADLWPNQFIWGHFGEELCRLCADLGVCAVAKEVKQIDQSTWEQKKKKDHLQREKKYRHTYTFVCVCVKYKNVSVKKTEKELLPLAIASLTNLVLEVRAYKVSRTICRPKGWKEKISASTQQ